MKDVWSWIKSKNFADPAGSLSKLDETRSCRLSTWGLDEHDVSLNDQLCGAVFLVSSQILTNNQFTATKAQMDDAASPYAEAAAICRLVRETLTFGRVTDAKKAALLIASDHLDSIVTLINRTNPRVLNRGSGARGDNLLRSHARELADINAMLLDTPAYGIVAKLLAVALRPSKPLDSKKIGEWCEGMPLPE